MAQKQNQKRNDSTSLQKSHSAWSNTKLTTLCVVTVILFSLVWLLLGLRIQGIGFIGETVYYIALGVVAALTLLCLIGFNKFKR